MVRKPEGKIRRQEIRNRSYREWESKQVRNMWHEGVQDRMAELRNKNERVGEGKADV